MIHQSTLKELTEDEYTLLWSVCNYVTNKMGMVCNPKWIGMFRVDRLIPLIEKVSTLKEEYYGVRDSLIGKLKQSTF